MSRRVELIPGFTAQELRAALAERSDLREQVEVLKETVEQRIDYDLRTILHEADWAHRLEADTLIPRAKHTSERDCLRWERVALQMVILFARPAGVDMDALKDEVACHDNGTPTLVYVEAQQRFYAGWAAQAREDLFGLRTPCPLCGDVPAQEQSGYAWPEGLTRHLEGRSNMRRCQVMRAALASCRQARVHPRLKLAEPNQPATCHPDLPAYTYGDGECEACYHARLQELREDIERDAQQWIGGVCSQRGHSWSPEQCVRCGVKRCWSSPQT